MIHRSKAWSQLKLTLLQTRKFQRLPTRRMAAKPRSLWTRNQLENTATGPHLELEMVWSATAGTSSLMIVRTSIPRTISPFTAFRGQAEFFSWVVLECLKRNRKCQTSSSTWASLLSMDQFCRVVSGQAYHGTQTHQILELPYEIYLGSSKFAGDSFQEFEPYRTSRIQVDCILITTLSFEGQVTQFHYGVHMSSTPFQQSTAPVLWPLAYVRRWVVLMSPWTRTISPTSSHVCLFCNKSHNSRDLLMNPIRFHYRMVLMCPICGGCGLNQWRTVEGHVKKYTAAQPNVASRKVETGEPHWRRLDLHLMNRMQAPGTEATYTTSVAKSTKWWGTHTLRPDLQMHLKRMGGPGCQHQGSCHCRSWRGRQRWWCGGQ